MIGSPPCTMFSVLQELLRGSRRSDPKKQEAFNEKLAAAVKHMECCCEVYCRQMKNGKYFIHEHPWGAKSWKLDCVQKLLEDDRVLQVKADMCTYGMKTWGGARGSW